MVSRDFNTRHKGLCTHALLNNLLNIIEHCKPLLHANEEVLQLLSLRAREDTMSWTLGLQFGSKTERQREHNVTTWPDHYFRMWHSNSKRSLCKVLTCTPVINRPLQELLGTNFSRTEATVILSCIIKTDGDRRHLGISTKNSLNFLAKDEPVFFQPGLFSDMTTADKRICTLLYILMRQQQLTTR